MTMIVHNLQDFFVRLVSSTSCLGIPGKFDGQVAAHGHLMKLHAAQLRPMKMHHTTNGVANRTI